MCQLSKNDIIKFRYFTLAIFNLSVCVTVTHILLYIKHYLYHSQHTNRMIERQTLPEIEFLNKLLIFLVIDSLDN